MTAPLGNVWEETAVAAPVVSAPPERSSTDVLVIGAGYLGLSTALHLAEAGIEAMVLDAAPPGFGASGRNGGQIIPGLKYDPAELETMFGRDAGERLWRFAGATADTVFDLVARHGLDCDARRTAWVQAIHHESVRARAERRAEDWRSRGAPVEFLDRAGIAGVAGTDIYVGGFVDRRAGALQPLSYARELARVALAHGVRIHDRAEVIALDRDGTGFRARTAAGAEVTAKRVVVATNAYSGPLVPDLAASIVAANSLQVATAPIPPELRRTLLPNGEVLSDTRRIIRYWRLDRDGRLLLGGRGPYREPRAARDWAHIVRDVAKLFPALAGIPITHRWGGRVAVHADYMPRLHRPQPGMTIAIGCQGRGVGLQTAMGKEVARLLADPTAVPVLPETPIRPIPFHGLKAIGVTATITLYRALDRLGIG